MNNEDKMKKGDLVIYTDNWGDKKQVLFVRWLGAGWAEIVRFDGMILQTAEVYIKKGVLNESR